MIELLKECLVSVPTKINGNGNDKGDNRFRDKKQATSTSLYDLSERMIQTTVAYFTQYYVVGRRHDFALCFSGTTWHTKISEASAGKILSQIATNTNDDEIQSRLNTLHATYERANEELIKAFKAVRDSVGELIEVLNQHQREYNKNPCEYYYSLRDASRHTLRELIQPRNDIAARFVTLVVNDG